MDIGIHNFLIGKHILSKYERIKVLKSFTKKYGTQAQDDFNRFATFVDQGIRSGEFKGKPVKLLTESTKQHIESEKERRFFANKISKSIWNLWHTAKNNKVKTRQHDSYSNIKQLILKYFNDNNLPHQWYVDEGNAPKCYEFIYWFQYIIDNNLVEDFTLFCKGE